MLFIVFIIVFIFDNHVFYIMPACFILMHVTFEIYNVIN